jgi:hypothetical protein
MTCRMGDPLCPCQDRPELTDAEVLLAALEALQWHYDRGYIESFTDMPRKRDARAIRLLKSVLSRIEP